jgi:hypothetical protein
MPEMLHPPERDRLIAFLQHNLLHPVPVDGQDLPALRETLADTPTATAAWTDAAAFGAELLAQPQVREGWAGLSGHLTDFLLAMGEGPLLHRGARATACRIDSADPQDFRVVTGAYVFTGDLSRGLVRQRAPGGREVLHTGHLVEFNSGGATHCLDVEDSNSHSGVEQQPDGSVLLFHESLFSARAGVMRRTRFVARLRYEYTIRPDDPRLRLRVMLKTAPKVTLREIRLTTAVDEMCGAPAERPFSRIILGSGGRHTGFTSTGEELATLHLGPADSLSMVEDAPAGQATGLHLGFPSKERLLSIKLVSKAPVAEAPRRPHWLLSRYRIPVLAGGESATVEEERLLTTGTLHGAEATYATWLRDPEPMRGRDPGLARGTGAALNAVAMQILSSATGEHVLPPERLARMRQWYARHLQGFFTALGGPAPLPACPQDLSFVLLSLDAMLQLPPSAANGTDHGALLEAGLAALLACQRGNGAFTSPAGGPDLGGHGAAILALSRLALRQPGERLTLALQQALFALRIGNMTVGLGEEARVVPTPTLRAPTRDGGWAMDDGRRSARLGLLMRGLGTLLLAVRSGAVPLEEAEQGYLLALHDSGFRLLRGRLRPAGAELEVMADSEQPEGDAITQSLVVLALLASEEAMLAMRGAATQPA